MPFRSRKQWRWGFANKMPFAHRWAHQAGYHSLPASKDAGADAGAPLYGPGGLLATPGLGVGRRKHKRWGIRTKAKQIVGNLYRGDTGRFQAGSGGGSAGGPPPRLSRASIPAPHPKLPKSAGPKGRGGGGKGRAAKPKKTDAQRAQEREQARAQRQQEATAQQAKNITKIGDATGMGDDLSNLDQFSQGKPLRPQDVDNLVSQGLMERGADGRPRMTGQGHSLVTAARRGDTQGARDAQSRGADHAAKQAELAQKRADAEKKKRDAEQKKLAKGGGGGGSKKPSDDQKQQQQVADRAKKADATAGRVGLAPGDVQALRQGAEAGGAQSDTLSKLGLLGADGQTTDQGRRALSALERGDVRGYNAALQDAKARQGREQAAAQRRQQVEGRRTRVQQERTARQQRQIEAIKKRARGGARLTTSEIRQLQDAGAVDAQGRLKAADPGDYLVVEDRTKPSTWHLQVKRSGTPDHRLMGAAWAALHGGYRGNVYQGPNKGAALDKLKALYRAEKLDLPAEKSFTVFKDTSGAYRWLSRTTTAYRDRDGEIISTKALESDAARMTATGQYGPLRYWHVGEPDPFDPVAPWGPGIDIGDCDYSIVIGRTSIESGTFKSAAIGRAFAETAGEYELSPGFFHPTDEPKADGTFDNTRRFERSAVPIKYGRASNLFTGLTVKEHRMDQQTYDARVKAFLEDMNGKGVPPEVAASHIGAMEQSDKSATDQRIAYKSEAQPADPWQVVVAALKAALAPETATEQATEKAAPADVSVETQAAGDLVDAGDADDLGMPGEDEAAEETDVIGNMSVADFEALLTSTLQSIFGPTDKMAEMLKAMSGMHDELKSMYTTKDDSRSAELATLKAAQAELAAKIARIESDQPAVILPEEVEAALKSAGPAAPTDPSEPQIPDRPMAELAAQLMPQLYGKTVQGYSPQNGWQFGPQSPPPNTGGN